MKYEKFNEDIFKEVDQVFKQVDKIFKQLDIRMEEAMESVSPRPWEAWFAWHPVKVHGKKKWFKTVYRREVPRYGDHRIFTPVLYEYGTVFDAIRDAGKN